MFIIFSFIFNDNGYPDMHYANVNGSIITLLLILLYIE